MANESLIFDILARDGASPSLKKVGDAALEAAGSMKDLGDKLKDVNGRVAKARVKLDGNKEAQHELDVTDAKLITLGNRVATGKIKLDGVARVRADISGIDLALDRLNAKSATASVGVSGGGRGLLAGLFGGGTGGGASSGGGGASSLVSGGLSSPVGIAGLVGGGLLAAGSIPGLVGAGLGGAVGLGAIGGGLFGAAQGKKVLTADLANITQVTTALKTAIGQQKKLLSADLVAANKQYAKDSAFYAPFTAFQAAITGLAQTVLKPLRPVLAPLTQIFTQFGKGLTALGPQLTALFRASLPFIRQFASVMLQSGKILLPAFTQALQTMVKSGALKEMTQGLVYLVQGFAGFIQALGPGMKASGQIFERVSLFIKDLMIGIGKTVSVIANVLEFNWGAAVKRMWRDTVTAFGAMRHDVASIFGRVRQDIAGVWDTIWRNTVTRVRNGISDVTGWFKGLPGRVVGALFGLGHSLYAFMRSAVSELWDGAKSVAGGVVSWFKGFGKSVLHAIGSIFHFGSPSKTMFKYGQWIVEGMHKGVESRLSAFTSSVKYKIGAGVGQWRGLVLEALRMEGLSTRLAGNVLYQMQTESGGNPNAINLTDSNAAAGDPSRGLMQTIGSTFRAYHWPGTSNNIYNPLANIAAALNYARHVYGPTLMSGGLGIGSGHGYDQGGWLMPGVTLAVNRTGRPERVLPPGQSGSSGPIRIDLTVRTAAGATVEVIQHHVSANGGNVQVALGEK